MTRQSQVRHPLIVYKSANRMPFSKSRSRPHRNSHNQEELARRSAIVRVGAVEEVNRKVN